MKKNSKSSSLNLFLIAKSTCPNATLKLNFAPMIKTLIVGMVFLGSLNVWAQPGVPAIEALIKLAATESKTSTAAITNNLLKQVEGSTSALAQAVKNDPLYVFNRGKLDEKSLGNLAPEAKGALVQLGRAGALKSIAGTSKFTSEYAFATSLTRAAESTPLSANGQVKVAVDPHKLIENEVNSIGLSTDVAGKLSSELKQFHKETGVFYTNRGMCKGLNDEAAENFSKLLKDTRENLGRTRQNCSGQFYASIAESLLKFENALGRTGDKVWSAAEKVCGVCYCANRMRPGVLAAINAIKVKNAGVLPAGAPTGCPL